MAVIAIVITLLTGAIAGWLAGLIMKGKGFGLIGNIVIGCAGGIIAGFIVPNVIPIFVVGSIVSATIGAIILLFVLRLLKR